MCTCWQGLILTSSFTKDARSNMSEEAVESRLCGVNDIPEGEAQEFTVEGAKVFVAKYKGEFQAIGGKCSHFGAPLIKGSYCDGRVRCPFHGASFNVCTGDIEDFPGFDSLPKFETVIKGGDVFLKSTKSDLANPKREKTMKGELEIAPDGPCVIIGGGGSGGTCAITLRQEGYKNKIVVITQEQYVPYNRPNLSKVLDSEIDKLALKPEEFFARNQIEFMFKKIVVGVDLKAKTVQLSSGESIGYKTLVIATGGAPRTLNCPGAELENVCYLRTPDDGRKISGLIKEKNVVVIGASFIGMEMAAYFSGKAATVTVIGGRNSVPFEPAFGKEIGAACLKLHESKGIVLKMGVSLKELKGSGGKVSEVHLSDGSSIPADVVVCGIGVEPATGFLKNSGIKMNTRGFVEVDANMRSSVPDVYATGDIVVFPLSSFGNSLCNVQHWQMALKHGRTAALHIAGKAEEIKTVPFFWTMLFGKSIRFTGYGHGTTDVIIRGDLDEPKFVAYYLKDGNLVAVATMGRDPVAAQIADCFRIGKRITKQDIEANETDDWSQLLKGG